jgi:hypothetical protein
MILWLDNETETKGGSEGERTSASIFSSGSGAVSCAAAGVAAGDVSAVGVGSVASTCAGAGLLPTAEEGTIPDFWSHYRLCDWSWSWCRHLVQSELFLVVAMKASLAKKE